MNNQVIYIKHKEDDEGNILSVECNLPYLKASKENGIHFALCPLLRTFGFSNKSEEDAVRELQKDLDIFFKIHIKRKTLKSALTSLDWVQGNEHQLGHRDIPFYLLQRAEMLTVAA